VVASILCYSVDVVLGVNFGRIRLMVRFLLMCSLLVLASSSRGGTYETVDGRRVRIKTISGRVHQRSGHVGPGENLRWAGLHRADLRGANLRYADLRNANLEKCNLSDTDIRGAVLVGVTLRGALVEGAKMGKSSLDGADLRGLRGWIKADWKGATFRRGFEPQWPEGMIPRDVGIQVRDE